MRRFLALLVLALSVITPTLARADHATGPVVTTVDEDAELRFLNRVNRERVARGLAPLTRDARLRDLARYHSADMALSSFVALSSPEAGSLIERAALRAGVAAADLTAQVAMGSDLTRAGAPLLDPSVTRAGIGIVEHDGLYYLTQLAVAGDAPRGYTGGDAPPHATALARLVAERFTAAFEMARARARGLAAFAPR